MCATALSYSLMLHTKAQQRTVAKYIGKAMPPTHDQFCQ